MTEGADCPAKKADTPFPPKVNIRIYQAGLLTCDSSETDPFPVFQWAALSVIGSSSLTVAGAVADLHRFPFSSETRTPDKI